MLIETWVVCERPKQREDIWVRSSSDDGTAVSWEARALTAGRDYPTTAAWLTPRGDEPATSRPSETTAEPVTPKVLFNVMYFMDHPLLTISIALWTNFVNSEYGIHSRRLVIHPAKLLHSTTSLWTTENTTWIISSLGMWEESWKFQ